MSIRKTVSKQGLQQVLTPESTQQAAYYVDDRGNEVQITSNMVRSVCHQLLKKCRNIQY